MANLREKLAPYGLDTPGPLSKALGTTRQWASQLLCGRPYGLKVSKDISRLIGLSWQEVYSWQDDNSKQKKRA